MLVHRRVTPSIKFAGTHLYTWVERGTMRVKCLAQEHNTMSPARTRTRTARSRDERTNHEATTPPTTDLYTCRLFHVTDTRFLLWEWQYFRTSSLDIFLWCVGHIKGKCPKKMSQDVPMISRHFKYFSVLSHKTCSEKDANSNSEVEINSVYVPSSPSGQRLFQFL